MQDMTPGTETPHSYADLLAQVQPRSITNEEEAAHVQRQIDRLIDQPERSAAEEALLSLLGDLVQAWEAGRYDLDAPSPAESIRALLEAHGLEQRDLVGPVFATKSIVSEILGGKRRLTYEYVERLAHFFHVSPSVFYR
jgi:HTH-type transcriptional regulator/antitoxin HigA